MQTYTRFLRTFVFNWTLRTHSPHMPCAQTIQGLVHMPCAHHTCHALTQPGASPGQACNPPDPHWYPLWYVCVDLVITTVHCMPSTCPAFHPELLGGRLLRLLVPLWLIFEIASYGSILFASWDGGAPSTEIKYNRVVWVISLCFAPRTGVQVLLSWTPVELSNFHSFCKQIPLKYFRSVPFGI